MSLVANPFVAILDANVMFPMRVRDVLLTFAHDGLFRARLTDEIIDEWRRGLIRLKPGLTVSIDRQITLIRTSFDECIVTGHMPLIHGLTLPDPDDRHVLAAAIRCSAQVIVTENHRHFPEDVLDEYGIETVSPDNFLVGTFELFPMDAVRSLRSIRTRYKRPPMNASEFLMDLTRSGMPKLAAIAKEHVEAI